MCRSWGRAAACAGDSIYSLTQLHGEGEAVTDDAELLKAGLADEQGGQLTHDVQELPGGVVNAPPDRDIHRDGP